MAGATSLRVETRMLKDEPPMRRGAWGPEPALRLAALIGYTNWGTAPGTATMQIEVFLDQSHHQMKTFIRLARFLELR